MLGCCEDCTIKVREWYKAGSPYTLFLSHPWLPNWIRDSGLSTLEPKGSGWRPAFSWKPSLIATARLNSNFQTQRIHNSAVGERWGLRRELGEHLGQPSHSEAQGREGTWVRSHSDGGAGRAGCGSPYRSSFCNRPALPLQCPSK